jgi:hypothetical protein
VHDLVQIGSERDALKDMQLKLAALAPMVKVLPVSHPFAE